MICKTELYRRLSLSLSLSLQQVEPFICDCVSISKRLSAAIEPFSEEKVPRNIKEAEESLNKHKLIRRETFESLHMDELASEGVLINRRLSEEPTGLQANPDYTNTLGTVRKLLAQIETVKERLESLWTTRHDKLEANLKQRVFEKEAQQVCSHHTGLGSHYECCVEV